MVPISTSLMPRQYRATTSVQHISGEKKKEERNLSLAFDDHSLRRSKGNQEFAESNHTEKVHIFARYRAERF
jgi:hypothetical protein